MTFFHSISNHSISSGTVRWFCFQHFNLNAHHVEIHRQGEIIRFEQFICSHHYIMKKRFESEWNWLKVLKKSNKPPGKKENIPPAESEANKNRFRPSHWDQVEADTGAGEAAKAWFKCGCWFGWISGFL